MLVLVMVIGVERHFGSWRKSNLLSLYRTVHLAEYKLNTDTSNWHTVQQYTNIIMDIRYDGIIA